MSNSVILDVSNFSFAYGDVQAVKNVSFTVKRGEFFSFLGPNGAGKTTVINTLITLLPMQEGTVTVAGYDLWADRVKVRESIGIVFQQITLDKDMTVRETLDFHGDIYGMDRDNKLQRISELLALVELEEKADVLVNNLSGGMKRRLEIARGLMTRPQILFLDEPTIGLDPQTRQKTWEYLRMVNQEGTTIFMTTHYMDEADILSDSIALIDHGEIIKRGTPDELKSGLGKDIIYLETSDNNAASALIRKIPGISGIQPCDGKLLICSGNDGAQVLPGIIRAADEQGIMVRSVSLKKPTMDDVFMHYTGTEIRD